MGRAVWLDFGPGGGLQGGRQCSPRLASSARARATGRAGARHGRSARRASQEASTRRGRGGRQEASGLRGRRASSDSADEHRVQRADGHPIVCAVGRELADSGPDRDCPLGCLPIALSGSDAGVLVPAGRRWRTWLCEPRALQEGLRGLPGCLQVGAAGYAPRGLLRRGIRRAVDERSVAASAGGIAVRRRSALPP